MKQYIWVSCPASWLNILSIIFLLRLVESQRLRLPHLCPDPNLWESFDFISCLIAPARTFKTLMHACIVGAEVLDSLQFGQSFFFFLPTEGDMPLV